MKLNLFYRFYAQTNLSADDYFTDILATIEPEYLHEVTDTRIIYSPVDFDDLKAARDNGLQTVDRELSFGDHPHFIIKEITVTFFEVPEDYVDVRDHIIDTFGAEATRYIVFEEGLLNDSGPFCGEDDDN